MPVDSLPGSDNLGAVTSLLRRVLLSSVCLALFAAWACADPLAGGSPVGIPGFTPRVPVSALARPLSWLDTSRMRVSTSVSVGSGFGGTTEALQVTRLSYQVGTPL